MDEQPVYIFADESCLGNQFRDTQRPGGAAGMIERFDERRGWYRRDFALFEADTTNNRMAITSGIAGLEALKRPCRVVFTTDSQYLVKGMKEWVHAWARRGWKRKGGPIENLALWKRLCRAAGRHEVEWRWVRGHAGHAKNEYANHLAVETATRRRGIEGTKPSGFEAWLQGEQENDRLLDFLDLPDDRPFEPDRAPPEV
ncbi:MAG TPA: RNase H family protein [Gemmatimonadota bacterium]|nr:RNase H family protein [Gemmatimonadota bacterium]